MAQATVLAAAITAANSTDIVVAAGEVFTVGVFSAATDVLPAGVTFDIMQKTPGAANKIGRMNNEDRFTTLNSPGTYYVARPAYTGTAFGVFTDAPAVV